MPMIDVYAAAGTFADKHTLAQDLATAVMAMRAGARTSRCSGRTPPRSCTTCRADGALQRRRRQQLRARPGADQRRRARTATSSSASCASSPTSSPRRPATRPSPTAPGCCSPKHPRAAGASAATPTPTPNYVTAARAQLAELANNAPAT